MKDNFYIVNKIDAYTVNTVKITDAPPVDLMEIIKTLLSSMNCKIKNINPSNPHNENIDWLNSTMNKLNTTIKSSDSIISTPDISIIDGTLWNAMSPNIDDKNICTIHWSFDTNKNTSISKVEPTFTYVSNVMNVFDYFKIGEEKFTDLLNAVTTPHKKANIYITHESFKKCNINKFYELYNDCIKARIYTYPGDTIKVVRYIYSTADKILI